MPDPKKQPQSGSQEQKSLDPSLESPFEKTQKANIQFKDVKQRNNSHNLFQWAEPEIIENPENNKESESVKRHFLLYKTLPTSQAKSKDEREIEEPGNTIYIISIEKDGIIMAYSIGQHGFSDQFHDISQLNMGIGDFNNQLDSTIQSESSVPDKISAFKEQLPGKNTYIDKDLQAQATEFLQNALKKKDEEKVADKPAMTPFSTIPKPY